MNFATETNISGIAYALEQTLGPMQQAKISNVMRGRWAVQTHDNGHEALVERLGRAEIRATGNDDPMLASRVKGIRP